MLWGHIWGSILQDFCNTECARSSCGRERDFPKIKVEGSNPFGRSCGMVAQLVERGAHNTEVPGSSPGHPIPGNF